MLFTNGPVPTMLVLDNFMTVRVLSGVKYFGGTYTSVYTYLHMHTQRVMCVHGVHTCSGTWVASTVKGRLKTTC